MIRYIHIAQFTIFYFLVPNFDLRSKLTEHRTRSQILRTFLIGFADVFLQAFVVRCDNGPDVTLQHGNPSHGSLADRILASQITSRHRPVRERRLQGVQKIDDDVDELIKNESH